MATSKPASVATRFAMAQMAVDNIVAAFHGRPQHVVNPAAIARRTARGLGGDVRVTSPCAEVIEHVKLGGSAFYLTVAPRAPADVPPDGSR